MAAMLTPLILVAALLADPPDGSTPNPAPVPAATPTAPAPTPAPPVPFPHPLITEVLYAVPNGPEGDANRDGARHVAGDEFVELINPHDRPIQLLGYTITDRNPPKKGQLRFVFPQLELPPGGVVVVFNGCDQGWAPSPPGSPLVVGDSRKPPEKPNEHFSGAYVFTMRVTSSRVSWANGGDYVLVSDPAGNPIHCVTWGTFKEPVPAATLVDQAPLTTTCSVQRRAINDIFVQHVDLPAEAGAQPALFSPGRFSPVVPPADPKPGDPQPAPKPSREPTPQRPRPLEIKPPPPKHGKP